MVKKFKSDALAAVHETIEALHEVGAVNRQTRREFDAACLTPIEPLSMNKVLKFAIAPVSVQRARSLAIAAGQRQRNKDDPDVWFPSVAAMARVLSDENMALLKVIRESHPDSMDALAKSVGKHVPNVSRSLHTMAQYGLVTLTKQGRTVMPQVTSDRVTVDFSWAN